MKIKVRKLFNGIGSSMKSFEFIKKGEWIDLRSAINIDFKAPQAETLKRRKVGGVEESYRNVSFDFKMIPLGIAMQLPKGYEAIVCPRSSTYKKFGIIQANHTGIIDSSYCGNDDEWMFPAIALRDTCINIDDRICQFRIQLSQKATIWQKIKWLFTNKIEFEWVNRLDGDNRGGFGSTGVR